MTVIPEIKATIKPHTFEIKLMESKASNLNESLEKL